MKINIFSTKSGWIVFFGMERNVIKIRSGKQLQSYFLKRQKQWRKMDLGFRATMQLFPLLIKMLLMLTLISHPIVVFSQNSFLEKPIIHSGNDTL